MKRAEVMAFRIHAQQVDRQPRRRPLAEAAIFDFGIQDTGRDGASWALDELDQKGSCRHDPDPDTCPEPTLALPSHEPTRCYTPAVE